MKNPDLLSGKRCISVVGAGGKTTLLKSLSKAYAEEGLKVLLMTTTHMAVESDTIVSDREESLESLKDRVEKKLNVDGICHVGMDAGTAKGVKGYDGIIRKLTRLPDGFESALMNCADIVIFEADGSKQNPAKLFRDGEPVLRDDTDLIFVIMGREALGHKAGEVLHRVETQGEMIGIAPDDIVTEVHFEKIFRLYEDKVRGHCRKADVVCLTARMQDGIRVYEEF